jgi:hypothetical protein
MRSAAKPTDEGPVDDELTNKMKAALRLPTGLQAAREFLQTYHHGSPVHFEKIVRHMWKVSPAVIAAGLAGVEQLLVEPQAPGVLADLVAVDANTSLDEYSDDAARAWLEELVATARGWTA